MKALKGILIVLLLVVVVLVVYIFTIDGKYNVQTTVAMKASPSTVEGIVSDLTTWKDWGVWLKNDPSMELSYGDPSAGKDASYSWTGNDGKGKLTIVDLEEGKSMKTFIEFDGMGNSNGFWNFEETEDGSDVTWGMHGEFGFMGKAYMLFTGNKDINAAMTEMVQEDFNAGLNNLKELAEAEELLSMVDIEEVNVESTAYYSITSEIPISEMNEEFFGANFGEIMGYLGQGAGATMTGMPFSIYHKWDEENGVTIIENCIPNSVEMEETDRIKRGLTHSGMAIKAVHKDSWDTGNEHWAMEAYVNKNNLEIIGSPWEIYASDPAIDPIVVEVYYPVKNKEEVTE